MLLHTEHALHCSRGCQLIERTVEVFVFLNGIGTAAAGVDTLGGITVIAVPLVLDIQLAVLCDMNGVAARGDDALGGAALRLGGAAIITVPLMLHVEAAVLRDVDGVAVALGDDALGGDVDLPVVAIIAVP